MDVIEGREVAALSGPGIPTGDFGEGIVELVDIGSVVRDFRTGIGLGDGGGEGEVEVVGCHRSRTEDFLLLERGFSDDPGGDGVGVSN